MKKDIRKRVIVYVIGLLILALGVNVSVQSGLGISPVNSLPYVIGNIAGIPMSICVICVFSVYVFLQFLILKKEFRWVNLTQVIFSAVFGFLVDATGFLVKRMQPHTYLEALVLLAVSIVCIALGILFYVQAALVPMPMEGLALAVAQKSGRPFASVKILIDGAVVLLGITLSLLFLHRLDGIREGTVITAVAVGWIMPALRKCFHPLLKWLLPK